MGSIAQGRVLLPGLPDPLALVPAERGMEHDMDIEAGNAGEVDTRGTGWFIGYSEWVNAGGANLRHVPQDGSGAGPWVKWFMHPAGHPNGEDKPVSEGRTVSLVAGPPGEFRLEFSRSPAFPAGETVTHMLRRTGDFVVWGEGIYHRAFGIKATCILTIRWRPGE